MLTRQRISLTLKMGIVLAISMFLIEFALMALPILGSLGVWGAVLDAGLLTLVVSPILYVSVLRPLAAQIAERAKAQKALLEVQASLERQVEGRTQGLADSLAALHSEVVERKRTEQELMRFKLGIERCGEAIFITAVDGEIIYANPAFEKLFGFGSEDWQGKTPRILKSGLLAQEVYENFWSTILGKQVVAGELINKTKEGQLLTVQSSANPILDHDGELIGFLAIQRDVTEQKRTQEALARAGAATQAVLGVASRLNAELSLEDTLQAVCDEGLQALPVDCVSISLYSEAANALIPAASVGLPGEYELAQPLPKTLYDEYVKRMGPLVVLPDVQQIQELPDAGLYADLDIRSVVVASMMREGELIGILSLVCLHKVRDFTPDELLLVEGLAAQAVQAVHGARLRDQLRQTQKLEAIGSLAGGIAHDFNNLLTPIIGGSELLLADWGTAHAKRSDVEEIRRAAERAAALTRQLLAFSRRQPLRPQLIDLNDVVGSMTGLLARVLGEDVSVEVRQSPQLWPVEADPNQIEQVIMNLAVNARDAMPGGGKLTIETGNVWLDDDYVSSHFESRPGPHVLLAVSDSGSGIETGILPQIFEPFFTTKGPGKGTGLGLSTVHGIIKQTGGDVWVYSEPDKGATFKIYLPKANRSAGNSSIESDKHQKQSSEIRGGTILLIEDEPTVRELAARILNRKGYEVLAAESGEEALVISNARQRALDLVLTDVVLPGMSGRELVETLQRRWPDLRVLYMSGYTRNAIVHDGRLDPGITFLEKPFTPQTLIDKIGSVMAAVGRT